MRAVRSMAATLRPAGRRVVGPGSDLRVRPWSDVEPRRRRLRCALCDRPRRCSTSPSPSASSPSASSRCSGRELADDVVEGPTGAEPRRGRPRRRCRSRCGVEAPFAVAVDDLRRDRGARARRRPAGDLPAGDRRARSPSTASRRTRRCATRSSRRASSRSRWRSRPSAAPAATPRRSSCPSYILAGGVLAAGRVSRVRLERRRHEAAEGHAAAAVAEERERLARELHDAVSHSLASIVMQAGGAQDVVRRDPSAPPRRSRRSSAPPAPASARCAACSGSSATASAPREPQPTLARARPPARRRRAKPGSTSTRRRRGRRARRCRRPSTCPRTASSRRRSPTR